MFYRVNKADLEPGLADLPELSGALAGLASCGAKVSADANGFISGYGKMLGDFRLQAGR